MNNKVVLTIVAVVVVLAGGYVLFGKGLSQKTGTGMMSGKASSVESFTGTITDLLAKKVPLQCEFSYKGTGDSTAQTKGKVLVSGTNMRGEFEMQTGSEKPTQTYMIRKGDEVYTWGMMGSKGYKITMTQDQIDSAQKEAAQKMDNTKTGAFDPNKQAANYQCSPWSGDESAFVPPKDIEFQDMSKMMEQTQMMQKTPSISGGAIDKSAACAACDAAPEAARAQCKQALGC